MLVLAGTAAGAGVVSGNPEGVELGDAGKTCSAIARSASRCRTIQWRTAMRGADSGVGHGARSVRSELACLVALGDRPADRCSSVEDNGPISVASNSSTRAPRK